MAEDARLRRLVEEALDSGLSPEQLCRDCPELLPELKSRLAAIRRVDAQVDALFPSPTSTPSTESQPVSLVDDELPQIPGYEIEAVLGRGGMGIVYKARQVGLKRSVAIKMLLAGRFASARDRVRFETEAEVVAGLRHPNIVQIYDVGTNDGRPYFTMEFMVGGSLAERLAHAPQPPAEAAALLVTLALAVDAAHQSGVIHRDLKPSNVLLDADGTAKVSDFGLAERVDANSGFTPSLTVLGTPSYMAPEQADGDPRASEPTVDVYALGAILYEMLTGRPPYPRGTRTAREPRAFTQDPVPPSRLNPSVPRDLETICLTCLRGKPEQRYRSAGALAADLRRFQRGEPVDARPVSAIERLWKAARRNPARAGLLAATVTVLAAGIWLVAWLGWRRSILERGVNDDLVVVAQHEREARWADARMVLERAKARLDAGGGETLRNRLERVDRDLVLVATLESIRLRRLVAVDDGKLDPRANRGWADGRYAAAFSGAGLGQVGDDPDAVAKRLASSDIRFALVAALDDWAVCASRDEDRARRTWILDVARRADPEPSAWRDRARDAAKWTDPAFLEELCRTAPKTARATPLCSGVADRIVSAGGDGAPLLLRIQADHPGDLWANIALGLALGERDPREALRYFQAALAIRPDVGVTHHNLGTALGVLGRYDDAIAELREAVRIEPTWAESHSNLVNALQMKGLLAEAVDAYHLALELEPASANVRANLGKALVALGRPKDALVEYREALRLAPGRNHVRLGLGFTLMRLHRPAEASLEFATVARVDPRSPSAQVGLGDAAMAQGRPIEAQRAYETALALGPNDSAANAGMSEVLRARRQLGAALEHGLTAIRLDARNAQAHNSCGITLQMMGRLDEAMAQYRAAIALEPQFSSAHANLGNALGDACRLEEAVESFRKARDIDPESANTHAGLAQALRLLGRFDEAQAAMRRGVELTPASHPARRLYEAELRRLDRLTALAVRLPAILAGRDTPANEAEAVEIAEVCRLKGAGLESARRFRALFESNPALVADPRDSNRFHGACAAVAAGTAAAADPPLTEAERAAWRQTARAWLAADLSGMADNVDLASDEYLAWTRRTLAQWLVDGALAGIRDDAALARIPADEVQACRALWRDVQAVRERARAPE